MALQLDTYPRTGTGRFQPPVDQAPTRDELYAMWTVARAEANIAYDGWCTRPSRDSYAIYRAAEDRADAAQDTLSGLLF